MVNASEVQALPLALIIDKGGFRMVRLITTLTACAFCASCTVMTGNGTGYTYASLGGNAEGLNITPSGATAGKIDNATGAALAKEAISDTASAYTIGKALDMGTNLIQEGADVIKED